MDLRLVEYFVAVIDHGGITKAAQALYLAQPSLSQAIRTMERQLGVQLFDRSGRRLRLTPEGESFAVAARQVLDDVERARSKAAAVRDLAAGWLDLVALPMLAVDPLPEFASRLRQQHPGIVLNVMEPDDAAGVLTAVRHGRAEIGLTDLPVKTRTLRSLVLGTQEFALALPPELAARLPDPVPLADVAGLPLVMETTDMSTRRLIGDPLDVVVECSQSEAVRALVRHGAGAAFLPRRLAENELAGVVVRSTEPVVRRSIGLVFRPGPLTPAALAFLDAAKAGAAALEAVTGRPATGPSPAGTPPE